MPEKKIDQGETVKALSKNQLFRIIMLTLMLAAPVSLATACDTPPPAAVQENDEDSSGNQSDNDESDDDEGDED